MNIWIIDFTGLNLFYKSFKHEPTNEVLVSGLLAAINQFVMVQFDQPIESLDMGGFRWIYIQDDEIEIIFVAADTKNIKAETLRNRLEIIRQKFIELYVQDKISWKGKWHGDLQDFKSFDGILEEYYHQWTEADSKISLADFFDTLGIHQQILNLLKKMVDIQIFEEAREKIYDKIEKLFQDIKDPSGNRECKELENISFARKYGFSIININPVNSDLTHIEDCIMKLLRNVVQIIKDEIGIKLSLYLFSDIKLFSYIFSNIFLLKKLNLDTDLLQLLLES